jgi:thiaminase
MNELYTYIQQETDKIMDQYRETLNDISDEQKEAVARLVKDIFKLGADFGAEVLSKL